MSMPARIVDMTADLADWRARREFLRQHGLSGMTIPCPSGGVWEVSRGDVALICAVLETRERPR